MNKLWILSLMIVWVANATSVPKRQYVTIPYQGKGYELRAALSGSRIYFGGNGLSYTYKEREIMVGGQERGDKLMVTDDQGHEIKLDKESVDPAIKEVMSVFKDMPDVIGQLQNCRMWHQQLKNYCKMKGPVGGRPSTRQAAVPEPTTDDHENLGNTESQGDGGNGAVDVSEHGSSTDVPTLDREISVKRYVVPAITILAIMAVAVAYRTKMVHMAMVVKKRVVAWWHRPTQKSEHAKVVQHHEVRN